jgi:maltooligosyltrehalose trehalohydrolase
VGYYADFDSMAALAKVYSRVFYHDGIWSSFRGRSHGRPVDRLRFPSYRFLAYDQDHDQIGNRAAGDRLLPEQLRVAAGLVLTSPYTPMLFMGEEWGASTPWQYFTDHTDPELAAAVSHGRRSEFRAYGWDPSQVPDPQDPETFLRSKLSWSELDSSPHKELLSWYRSLLALRRSEPSLTDPRLSLIDVVFDEADRWIVVTRGALRVAAHFGTAAATLPLGAVGVSVLAASGVGIALSGSSLTMPPMSFAVVRVA